MNVELKNKLDGVCSRYAADGLRIIGVAGSYARGEETSGSDLDLVYEIVNPAQFVSKYSGFGAFSKIAEIKKEIEVQMQVPVDLIALSSLNEIGRKYILEDMQRVG